MTKPNPAIVTAPTTSIGIQRRLSKAGMILWGRVVLSQYTINSKLPIQKHVTAVVIVDGFASNELIAFCAVFGYVVWLFIKKVSRKICFNVNTM